MALTRAKRGRSRLQQHVKKLRDRSRKRQSDSPKDVKRISSDEERSSESESTEEQSFPERLIMGEAPASSSGTVALLSPGTPAEGPSSSGGVSAPAPADAEAETDDYFPQFVIDSKPDFRLAASGDDDEDHDNDSDDIFRTEDMFVIDKTSSSVNFDRLETAEDVSRNEPGTESFVITSPKKKSKVKQKSSGKTNKEQKSPDTDVTKESTVDLAPPCEIDPGLDMGDCYINLDGEDAVASKNTIQQVLLKSQQDKLIKKSVLTPDFEKKHNISPYKTAIRQLKKQRKKERDASLGSGWFGMKAAEMTDELRNDIKVVRMRSMLDPKRFYKGNDMAAMPKFVQVGTVVDSPVDFYHSRVPKKQRKQTLVDELLTDADSRRYNKRKYMELQEKFNNFTRGGKKRKFGKKNGGNKR